MPWPVFADSTVVQGVRLSFRLSSCCSAAPFADRPEPSAAACPVVVVGLSLAPGVVAPPPGRGTRARCKSRATKTLFEGKPAVQSSDHHSTFRPPVGGKNKIPKTEHWSAGRPDAGRQTGRRVGHGMSASKGGQGGCDLWPLHGTLFRRDMGCPVWGRGVPSGAGFGLARGLQGKG